METVIMTAYSLARLNSNKKYLFYIHIYYIHTSIWPVNPNISLDNCYLWDTVSACYTYKSAPFTPATNSGICKHNSCVCWYETADLTATTFTLPAGHTPWQTVLMNISSQTTSLTNCPHDSRFIHNHQLLISQWKLITMDLPCCLDGIHWAVYTLHTHCLLVSCPVHQYTRMHGPQETYAPSHMAQTHGRRQHSSHFLPCLFCQR